jgi:hypothetical protein
MPTLHELLTEEAQRVRQTLSQIDSLSSFRLDIEISGRVHSGELKIEYKLGEQYTLNFVSSNEITSLVEEFMRRHGWNEAHQAKLLTYEGAKDEPILS